MKFRFTARTAMMVMAALTLISCIAPDQARSPEEKGIRQTDYLHSLAGVYTAPLPGSPVSPGEILLALYTDGTCLFADKRFNTVSASVMTGRWDVDAKDKLMTLRLKNARGARRVLVLSRQEPDLRVTGSDFGPEGLLLHRRDTVSR